MEIIPCVSCGKEINWTQGSCIYCGRRYRTQGYRRKATAVVLATFFGGLGAHRFYLRDWWGFVYLIFGITLIPSLSGIFEGIAYAGTPREAWDAKHNEGLAAAPRERPLTGLVLSIAVVIGALATATLTIKSMIEEEARARSVLLGQWETATFSDFMPSSCGAVTIQFTPDQLIARSGDYQNVMGYSISGSGKTLAVIPKLESDNGSSDCRGRTADAAGRYWAMPIELDLTGKEPALRKCAGLLGGCLVLNKLRTSTATPN